MQAPILVGEVELTEPISDAWPLVRTDGRQYHGVHLLVRMQHIPVGYVLVSRDQATPGMIRHLIWEAHGAVINERLVAAGLDTLNELPVAGVLLEQVLEEQIAATPPVSVVVCTRDRPESLLVTLRGLSVLRYAPFEVVVVDNAPSSSATEDAVRAEFGGDSRFKYVREPRPGLSCARNRGLAEATADVVAFTDDDVRVDPWWLTGIVGGFQAASDVACVTGLIKAAELENDAQLYFHLRQNWGVNCERRVFDMVENRDNSRLYPYSAGVFGAGANFAVSRSALKDVGHFNEALGAGTPSGGGEDLNIFMRIILAGHRIVYEPSAIVAHVHRSDLADLSSQMRAYGSGCSAAITAIVLCSPRAMRELPPKVLVGVVRMHKLSRDVRRDQTLPSGLIRREIGGFIAGPWLYFKGRR